VRKILSFFILIVLAFTLVLISSWGTLALFYASTSHEILRYAVAVVFALFSFIALITLVTRKYRQPAFVLYTFSWTLLLLWYSTVQPSNHRQWQEDVALLPYVKQTENNITFYNIRNFHYKSETDYTPDYYDKSFNLSKLNGVDIITVYWMGPAVAHVFVSFSFEEGEHLAVSIETRKEKNEGYSTIKGLFRQYELSYVVADERDVIGLRTNHRFDPIEDVYIYPMSGSREDAKKLFLAYIKKINALHEHPEFYNTLTTNCTTNIWMNANSSIERLPISWKILVSGYVPEYLYENNRLRTGNLSFEALREHVHVNKRALDAGIVDNFSKKIRTIHHHEEGSY